MADNNLGILKAALVIASISCAVYGLFMFFLPGLMVKISSGPTLEYAWVRWPASLLIALAVGFIRLSSNPVGHDIFIVTLILGSLLMAVALVISLLLGEFTGATWFIVLPIVLALVIGIVALWGRQKAKDIP